MTEVHSTTLLDKTGDTTVVWTEDQDDDMERIIQKKMDEGMTFFLLEPRFYGLLPSKKIPLQDVKDAKKYRALSIDEDFATFVGEGKGELTKASDKPIVTKGRAKTAMQAVKTDTIGVKRARGG